MTQLLYVIASLHVFLCPYSKVEESFNIQAVHDILYHRHNLSQYDHNEFPGVVPRTFLGPLVVSALAAPAVTIFHMIGANKFWTQYEVRLTLALIVIGAWSRLRNTLQKQFGSTFSWWFTIITVTQYHFMFYMSRALPNIMVLPLVLLAFEGWIRGNHKQFIAMAGASIVIFRSELAMLFGLFLIIDLYFKKISLQSLFKLVVPIGLSLVGLTIAVDSIFWGRLLWPEAEVFWFNTVLNKSSNWGTMPFLWYFYSALPRGLGPSLVLVPVGLYLDRRFIQYVAPAVTYVLLYSILPHKELRFIIYVFPLLNMASAAACSYIYMRRTKAPIYELLFWGTVVVVVGNIMLCLAFITVAMKNYPGGAAITKFHKLLKDEPYVNVHICNLAAQTGVTRFTELYSHWTYSKNESLTPEQLQQYTHLLVEAKSRYSPTLKAFTHTHVILDNVDTFAQINMNSKIFPPIKIKMKPAIFILERKDFREDSMGYDIKNLDVDDEDSGQVSNEEIVVDYKDVPKEELKVVSKIQPSKVDDSADDVEDVVPDETIAHESEIELDKIETTSEDNIQPQHTPKQYFDELKAMRQERKQRAINKIKSETRKEVVASAKAKLREIMNKRKQLNALKVEQIAEETQDSRGDIPEGDQNIQEKENPIDLTEDDRDIKIANISINVPSQEVDHIVEEVIVRLIDRKFYDGKTKPEDLGAEDRKIIHDIVEEVLNEKVNKSHMEYR